MTTEQVLAMLRRKLNEVDTSTSVLTDEELLAVVSDARDMFEVEGFTDFEAITVGYSQTEDGYGIDPEPALDLGYLLVLGAAVHILRAAYAGRVSRGEIGISWRSGLEEESTISAGQAYRNAIVDVENELEHKKMLKLASQAGVRQQ